MSGRRIFFLTTDENSPSGGRKVIYSLVDMLRDLGYEAYALHQRKGFRYTWFANETPTAWTSEIRKARHATRGALSRCKLYAALLRESLMASDGGDEVAITPEDILILPENRVTHLDNIFPGVPKVIFNQNPYIFLRQAGLSDLEETINHPDIRAWWCVSDLIVETMKFLNVPQPVHLIPNYIDVNLFSFSSTKRKQIAYMPRKLKDDADALINLLKIRGNLNGFEFVPIDGIPPESVAKILKESLIFLSFSHREGFGLPPAEAIACGCTVIGYTGNAGEEFTQNSSWIPVVEGDLLAFAQEVERQVVDFDATVDEIELTQANGAVEIINKYNALKSIECVKIALIEWNL